MNSDLRASALVAGMSLLGMAIAAGFSYGYVHGNLVIPGDAGATYENIASSAPLFAAALFGWLVVLMLDVVVAWAFYVFLKPIRPRLALLGAWLRLAYAAILGVAIACLFVSSLLASGAVDTSSFPPEQLHALTNLFLEAFDSIWSMGLIVFGAHLWVTGWVSSRSNRIPKLWSILLLIAAVGYAVIHIGNAFLPSSDRIVAALETVFMVPMVAGELGFGLWLLFKGGKLSSAPAQAPPTGGPVA
ncbi:DUF4386 domain-containing protein [Paenibacillus antri]|uniref:DUF4386 domain-containing protein n=1 Tax=Paenibacillus antri TaxID=2582848 RepID=A0A5R9G5I2_9BACL|nr:DUF4386 domain-containing protein [Paenibacillus antri]TLS51622.1 DUF4386 domain-containing protein [Paenibacillus antri]